MSLIAQQLRPALLSTLLLAALTGLVYPLVITGIAQVVFPYQANGSLVRGADGSVVGSELIGQRFSSPRYFHGRPSMTVDASDPSKRVPYNAANSAASNLGPTNRALLDAVEQRARAYRAENGLSPDTPVPVDAVTASASGLDPHITPANAALQVARVAKARGMTPEQVQALVAQHTEGRTLGFLGEPRVNVLELNLALDAAQA